MTRILVVGPSWVGDMVMAQSLFKLLRQRDATCTIDVLAPKWSHPILARMPEVNQALELPLTHGDLGLKTRWRLGRALSLHGYDQAVVLPRSWKSALVPFAAGIPQRTGFLGELRYGLLNDRRPFNTQVLNQTVKRFAALGLPRGTPNWAEQMDTLPWPALRVDMANQSRLFNELGLESRRPAVALMPGAEYGPAKQWPLAYFKAVALAMLQRGYQVWVLGSHKDRSSAEEIIKDLPAPAFNLCGLTQLADTVDLLAYAQHAVTNDSGLMHVAAAVGTKVHAIYGSSSPQFTPPLTDNKVIHYLALECSPCFDRKCRLGHLRCLREITPEQIVSNQAGVSEFKVGD